MDIFRALRMAIQSEKHAREMYEELAEQASDPEVKALFSYLAEYEVMHQRFLEAERTALKAAQGDDTGRPSHWLKILREEVNTGLGSTPETTDGGLEQVRLNLTAAESIARILKNANDELSRKQARYEQELGIAADIQRKLLPQSFPQNTNLDIAAENIMARSVGGDFYDFMVNDQGQLAIVVADSMGKGIPAALLMTTVRAIWRSCYTANEKKPGQILKAINRAVYEDLKAAEAFVTMFVALYDPAASSFQYSSAGHNPPIFRPALATECKKLDIGGTPVGIFPDHDFPGGEFSVSQHDTIVIYTDGVVEAVDKNNRPFGEERLCRLMDQNHSPDAESVKNAILSEVDSYTDGLPQADDITVVVLRKNGMIS